MTKKLNKFFILILVFIVVSINSAIAAPPFIETQVIDNNLFVLYPKEVNLKINKDFIFNVHVFNQSGIILDNTSTDCYLHLYNNKGEHIFRDKLSYNTGDFFTYINGSHLNQTGEYPWNVWCNNTVGGGASGEFYVLKTGYGDEKQNTLPFAIILIIFICFLYWLAFEFKESHIFLSLGLVLISTTLFPILGAFAYSMSINTVVEVAGLAFFEFIFRLIYLIWLYVFIYGVYRLFMFFGVDLWQKLKVRFRK